MVSHENWIILVCAVVGMLGSYAAAWLDLPGPLVLAILLGVGVVVPFLINERPGVFEDV